MFLGQATTSLSASVAGENQIELYLIVDWLLDVILLQESEQLDNIGVLVHSFCSD